MTDACDDQKKDGAGKTAPLEQQRHEYQEEPVTYDNRPVMIQLTVCYECLSNLVSIFTA